MKTFTQKNKKIKVLYIYGYNTVPGESKAVKFYKKHVPSEVDFHCIEYPQVDAQKSLQVLRQYIADNNIDLVIGSSLGAFLTLLMYDMPRIVTNPCMEPSKILPEIGAPDAMVKSYAEAEKGLGKDKITTNVLGMFGDEDELLGDRFIKKFEEMYTEPQTIHCGHSIPEDVVKTISSKLVEFYNNLNENERRN